MSLGNIGFGNEEEARTACRFVQKPGNGDTDEVPSLSIQARDVSDLKPGMLLADSSFATVVLEPAQECFAIFGKGQALSLFVHFDRIREHFRTSGLYPFGRDAANPRVSRLRFGNQ